jgi:hypothetical protein
LSNDESYIKQFSNKQIVWEFGDGTTGYGDNVTHYFKWPGVYVVSATIYDKFGDAYVIFADNELTVFNALPDQVSIGGLNNRTGDILYPLLAGKKSPPIKIYRTNSWQSDNFLKDNDYTVFLYASGSQSDFLSVSSYYSSSWSHLRSYFAFVEERTNVNNIVEDIVVDRTTTTSTSVFAEVINTGFFNNNWDIKLKFHGTQVPNSVFCGTTGVESTNLRFVDQKPSLENKNSLVLLYGMVDTSIYRDENYIKYNYRSDEPYGVVNYPYSTILIKTLFNPAKSIKITSNGISLEGIDQENNIDLQKNYSFDIYPLKYVKTKIPFVCTFKDKDNFTTKCYNNLVLNNNSDLSIGDIKIDLLEYKDNHTSPVDCIIQKNSDVPAFETGTYFAGTIEIDREIEVASISATALILDDNVPEPNEDFGFIFQPGKNQFRRVKGFYEYGFRNTKQFAVETTSIFDTFEARLSGGINITYAPMYLKDPEEEGYVWITNSANDSLLLFNKEGIQIRPILFFRRLRVLRPLGAGTFILDALGENRSGSPCNIAVDTTGSAWVTLRDSISSFKIDKDTLVATAVAIPDVSNRALYTNNDYIIMSGFAGEDLIQPSSVDVDSEDNVYISYTHPLCSFIAKYDNTGKQQLFIPFLFPDPVKQLLVDVEDNLWITTMNSSSLLDDESGQTTTIVNRTDRLYYINTKTLGVSIKTFSMLGDLTMDAGGNVWFNSQNNKLHRVTSDGNVLTFTIGTQESQTDYVQDFGGIAGDLEGNIWIINNSEGLLQFFNSNNPKQTPINQIPSVVLPGISDINPDSGTFSYYQTIGDFTGIRWALRNKIETSTFSRIITGESNFFTIKNTGPIVTKQNENYNLYETVRGYVTQESLFNSESLFENFFKPILIGEDDNVDEVGKVIYERISNFVNNNSDIDYCNVFALKSMFKMIGENFQDFNIAVPQNIKRVIDLLSIKKCLLFGNFNNFSKSFLLSTFDYSPKNNLGPEIDIETGTFLPGFPLVSYELFTKKYNLVTNTLIPESDAKSLTPYPLSSVKYNWGWGLVLGNKEQDFKEIKKYYKFYKFVPNFERQIIDNYIDFESPYSKVDSSLSAYSDWIGYGKMMDYIIGSNLYDSLNLVNSNTSIENN